MTGNAWIYERSTRDVIEDGVTLGCLAAVLLALLAATWLTLGAA